MRSSTKRGAVMTAVAGLFLLGWAAPGWGSQDIRIGIVDVQEILNQSQKGIVVKQRLERERAARQKELDGRQQEAMKLQAELEKQTSLLSKQAIREKSEAIQRKVRDARRMAEDVNRDFERRVREAETDITREIIGVIQAYGKDQDYSIILERSAVLFSTSAVDLTPEIIKRFDGKPQ